MEQNTMAKNLKSVESIKISQASKLLRSLPHKQQFWAEALIAESVLLKSGLILELLRSKGDKRMPPEDLLSATATVSDFYFKVKKADRCDSAEFFILVLIRDMDVATSGFVRQLNGALIFDESFSFHIESNSKVTLQIYSKKMPHCSPFSTLRKKNDRHSTMRLIYEDIISRDMLEEDVLKTSLKLCGEVTIDLFSCNKKEWQLQVPESSNLESNAFFTIGLKDFQVERRDFLTVGRSINGRIDWNRYWCVLDKSRFIKIFNDPYSEQFGRPVMVLNLTRCLDVTIQRASRSICARSRCFMVQVYEDKGGICKYFFRPDDEDSLRLWLRDTNLAINRNEI